MSKWILYKPARLTFSFPNAFGMCSTCVGRTCGICELGVRKTWTTQCQEGEEVSNAEGKMKKDFRSMGSASLPMFGLLINSKPLRVLFPDSVVSVYTYI